MSKETTEEVGLGKSPFSGTGYQRMTLPENTTLQLTLSTANRDPTIFGKYSSEESDASRNGSTVVIVIVIFMT